MEAKQWSYFKAGRMHQVALKTGDDVARLAELDKKQWLAISMPVKGVRFDTRMLELMEQEISKAAAGRPAYIGIKINALTDKKIIDQLIMASKAGVQVELLVRGICCLKPGIPGETENIRVVSVVGRFLEHSRVYIFGRGETESIFISSADFMTRNAANRVEVALPVLDAGIKEQLRGMFRTMMQDNYQAWEQHSDGSYQRVSSTAGELNSQEYFFAKAYEIAAGRK